MSRLNISDIHLWSKQAVFPACTVWTHSLHNIPVKLSRTDPFLLLSLRVGGGREMS